MKTIEQLERENAELRVKIFNISKAWRLASSDISSLFETQPMNKCDGSYDIDGQSCHELYLAIDKTPAQHLSDIKIAAQEDFIRAARDDLSNHIKEASGIDADFLISLKFADRMFQEYANSLRGESK